MNTKKIKSITRKEYTILNFKDQLKTVLKFGKFVDTHITSVGESLITNLYKFNLFYIEVVYSSLGKKVKEINSYKFGKPTQNFLP